MKTLIASILLLLTASACGAASADDTGAVATLADQPTPTAVPETPTAEPETVTTETLTPEVAPDSTDDAPAAAEEVDTEAQLIQFAACMREQGIDMEDPTVDADGNVQMSPPRSGFGDASFRDEMRAAAAECQEFLEGVELGFQAGGNTEFQDQLLEFSSCMRDNGVEMDDIEIGANRPGGALGDIDTESPEWVAAFEVCGDILAGFGPGTANGR
ncbi:MAG: hypothetical protein AAF567_17545 [Actinomycetota bacterium]